MMDARFIAGFYGAMKDVQDIVKSTVALAKAANPTYQIITAGHSLGAAVGALLGTRAIWWTSTPTDNRIWYGRHF
jgi:putative lipase involved disintegration of autophagic bodies